LLAKRSAELAKDGHKVSTLTDYRKVLEDKDIDAVIIGTPDHWHAKMMVDAASAGKDIYCEKPTGHSIEECRAMVAAQQKYHNVVQVGQWQRSQKHFQDAVDFVHSGKLGKVRLVKTWAYIGWKDEVPVQPDSPVPPGVHYDQWLGPAPKRPFNINRFHFSFRWFYDYAGGLMTDWGVHMIDYAMLGMKASHRFPKAISAIGGKTGYPNDAEQWPDTMSALYDFGDFNMVWEQAMGIGGGPYGRGHGVAFIGNKGTLVLDRGGWEVIPERKSSGLLMEAVPKQKSVDNGLDLHTKNFVEVIKSRKLTDLKTPIEDGCQVAMNCCMGNIAQRVGKTIHWDDKALKFTDKESNQYLKYPYHNGIAFPKA
jgi:predicted dehydrogenase